MLSKPTVSASKMDKSCVCGKDSQRGSLCCCGGAGKKLFLVLVGILVVYLICFVGTLVRNNIKKYDRIGIADGMEHSIVVTGYGKVTGTNDIAMTTIGYSNVDKDVAKAQSDNKKVMDQVVADLKTMGVNDKDMQTNYFIYPEYNYTQDRGQELVGYRVSNQTTVKIRDLSKIPTILGLAGKYGASEVSGLNFTIDDPENLKSEARALSVNDAKMKAMVLAQALGVRLGDIISYNEYESGIDSYMPLKYGLGAEGGGAVSVAPESISSGSKDVIINSNITFEILP